MIRLSWNNINDVSYDIYKDTKFINGKLITPKKSSSYYASTEDNTYLDTKTSTDVDSLYYMVGYFNKKTYSYIVSSCIKVDTTSIANDSIQNIFIPYFDSDNYLQNNTAEMELFSTKSSNNSSPYIKDGSYVSDNAFDLNYITPLSNNYILTTIVSIPNIASTTSYNIFELENYSLDIVTEDNLNYIQDINGTKYLINLSNKVNTFNFYTYDKKIGLILNGTKVWEISYTNPNSQLYILKLNKNSVYNTMYELIYLVDNYDSTLIQNIPSINKAKSDMNSKIYFVYNTENYSFKEYINGVDYLKQDNIILNNTYSNNFFIETKNNTNCYTTKSYLDNDITTFTIEFKVCRFQNRTFTLFNYGDIISIYADNDGKIFFKNTNNPTNNPSTSIIDARFTLEKNIEYGIVFILQNGSINLYIDGNLVYLNSNVYVSQYRKSTILFGETSISSTDVFKNNNPNKIGVIYDLAVYGYNRYSVLGNKNIVQQKTLYTLGGLQIYFEGNSDGMVFLIVDLNIKNKDILLVEIYIGKDLDSLVSSDNLYSSGMMNEYGFSSYIDPNIVKNDSYMIVLIKKRSVDSSVILQSDAFTYNIKSRYNDYIELPTEVDSSEVVDGSAYHIRSNMNTYLSPNPLEMPFLDSSKSIYNRAGYIGIVSNFNTSLTATYSKTTDFTIEIEGYILDNLDTSTKTIFKSYNPYDTSTYFSLELVGRNIMFVCSDTTSKDSKLVYTLPNIPTFSLYICRVGNILSIYSYNVLVFDYVNKIPYLTHYISTNCFMALRRYCISKSSIYGVSKEDIEGNRRYDMNYDLFDSSYRMGNFGRVKYSSDKYWVLDTVFALSMTDGDKKELCNKVDSRTLGGIYGSVITQNNTNYPLIFNNSNNKFDYTLYDNSVLSTYTFIFDFIVNPKNSINNTSYLVQFDTFQCYIDYNISAIIFKHANVIRYIYKFNADNPIRNYNIVIERNGGSIQYRINQRKVYSYNSNTLPTIKKITLGGSFLGIISNIRLYKNRTLYNTTALLKGEYPYGAVDILLRATDNTLTIFAPSYTDLSKGITIYRSNGYFNNYEDKSVYKVFYPTEEAYTYSTTIDDPNNNTDRFYMASVIGKDSNTPYYSHVAYLGFSNDPYYTDTIALVGSHYGVIGDYSLNKYKVEPINVVHTPLCIAGLMTQVNSNRYIYNTKGYVYVDHQYDFGTNDFTIEMWAMVDMSISDQWGRLFCIGDVTYGHLHLCKDNQTNTSNKFLLEIVPNRNTNAFEQFWTTNTYGDMKWNHFSVTRKDGIFYLHVNGYLINKLDSSSAKAMQISSKRIYIGSNTGGGEVCSGGIFNFQVYSKSFRPTNGNFSPLDINDNIADIIDLKVSSKYGVQDLNSSNVVSRSSSSRIAVTSNDNDNILTYRDESLSYTVPYTFFQNSFTSFADGRTYNSATNIECKSVGTGDFTFELWMNTYEFDGNGYNRRYFSIGKNGGSIALSSQRYTNTAYLDYNGQRGISNFDYTLPYSDNIYITLMRKNGTFYFYLNGILIDTMPNQAPLNLYDGITIGNDRVRYANAFGTYKACRFTELARYPTKTYLYAHPITDNNFNIEDYDNYMGSLFTDYVMPAPPTDTTGSNSGDISSSDVSSTG